MQRPVHFELNVPDPEKSVNFFQTVFGWSFQQFGDQPYWLATTGEDEAMGINGAVQGAADGIARTVNTMGVDDIDAASAKVMDAGGSVALEKMAIEGMGWVAYFTDPNGLVFGIFQEDAEASS